MLKVLGQAINENRNFDIFCIGTPKIIGDSVGPRIGTALQQYDFPRHDINIIGSMIQPIVKSNYDEMRERIRHGAYVIAIDATVGRPPGTWSIVEGSLYPGAGVHKKVPPVGDAAIKCYTSDTPHGLLVVNKYTVSMLVYDITTRLAASLYGAKRKEYIRQ